MENNKIASRKVYQRINGGEWKLDYSSHDEAFVYQMLAGELAGRYINKTKTIAKISRRHDYKTDYNELTVVYRPFVGERQTVETKVVYYVNI